MSTITTILEPHEDGTLHLAVPAAWAKRPIRVTAELEPVSCVPEAQLERPLKGFGCLRGRISMSPAFDRRLEDFKDYAE